MKSFLNKILIVAVLALMVPFFSYSAPTPRVTCSPTYSNDLVGKVVTFTAYVENGSGAAYSYRWDGDDGEIGTSETLNHIYNTEGQKSVSVIASSTDSSDYLTANCYPGPYIYKIENLPDYTASCIPSTNSAVIGQKITWNSNVSGPLEPYAIVWTGTDFGSNTGSSIAYASSGSKTAKMVSLQSRYGEETPIHNTKLSSVNCTAEVVVVGEEIHNPTKLNVSGSCSAASATQYLNSTTTWNSSIVISGGVETYIKNWVDNEGNIGEGDSVSKVYSTIGTKGASLIVEDDSGQSVRLDCGSVSVIATSTDGNTGGGDTGGDTGGDSNVSSGRRSSSRVNVVEDNATSTDQVDIDNLVAWLKNNPDLFSPVPQNIAALDLENPIASSTLANGTSSADTVASSTESENSLAAAAASALGSASKYVWYIAGLVLLGLAGWLAFFLLKRRNKKDKIS